MAADVRLAISVDSTGAVTSVKQLNDALDQTPKSAVATGLSLDKLKGPAMAAGAAMTAFGVAVVGAGAFVAAQAGKLAKYSDEVVTLANKFKITTDAVQLFRIAATVGGTTIEGIATAMQKMQVAIGKGDDVFSRLGLSLSNLKSMAPDEALAAVAKRISEIKAPAEQAAAAVEAFGKQGLSVLPALAEGFAELKRTSQEYGLVLKGEVVAAAEAFGDRFDLVNQAWHAFLMRIGAVIANSPAVMTVLDELGKAFGSMSKYIDENQKALTAWVAYGVDLAADAVWTLVWAIEKAIKGFEFLSGISAVRWASGTTSSLDPLIAKMKDFAEKTRDAARAKSAWAAIDMGGSGVLLPGGVLPKQSGVIGGGNYSGGGGGGASSAVANQHQVWQSFYDRLAEGATRAISGFIASSSNKDAMPGLEKYILGMLPQTLAVPLGPDGKPKQYSFDNSTTASAAVTKSSITVAQALQNLANVASLSSSKLGKSIASIAGGAVGALSGLDMFKGAGGGLTGLLGKIGGIGSIASSVLSLGSSLFGLFKSKPKTPAPEPPKQATAEAWSQFTGDQLGKGAAGVLAGVSGIKVTTPEDMASQGIIASGIFWQMFKERGIQAAADAFRPIRDKMLETFRAAGADDGAINAMLGPMSQQIDLAANDAFKGASEGSKGFADALAAMANSQLPMTIDQFRAFELQAVNGFNQMRDAAVDQGLSMEEAIRAAALSSGTYLQTIRDAAAKYGFSLGGGTQGLFDEATAAGVAFGGSSQERLIMSIDRLTETLGGAPPKFEQAIAAGSQSGTRGPGADPLAPGVDFRAGFADVSAAIRDLANRPVEVHSTINSHLSIDGTAIADAVANEFERGGPGGTRMREALDGRG